MGLFKNKSYQKIPTDEYIESGKTAKAKHVKLRIYDDDYFDGQLTKLSKILPTIRGKEIYMEYVTNKDRVEESLEKIDRIISLDRKRIVLNVTEPVKFYMKDGLVHSDKTTLKILFHIKPEK